MRPHGRILFLCSLLQWLGGPYESSPRLIVRSTTFINAKDVLTISYGPHKNRQHSQKQRRKLLQDQYHFHCDCAPCAEPERYPGH